MLNEERGKNRILTFVILLVILQGVLRIAIFIASYQVDFLEEGQVSDDNLSLMNTMFLILGIAGLAFVYPADQKARHRVLRDNRGQRRHNCLRRLGPGRCPILGRDGDRYTDSNDCAAFLRQRRVAEGG